jgi:PKD repeat protein
MKKITGVIVAITMSLSSVATFAPFIASAQATDTEAQLIALYTQLIQILQAQLAALQGGASASNFSGSISLPGSNATVQINTNAPVAQSLSALPLSGPAPLTVNFSGIISGSSFSLFFDDGTATQTGSCSSTCTSLSISAAHTYNTAGTHVAKLVNLTDSSTAGTVTIVVTASATQSTQYSFSSSPSSGTVPLTTSLSWLPSTVSGDSSLYYISFGDSSATSSAWVAGSNGFVSQSHAYSSAGTYVASLIKTASNAAVASTTVTASSAVTPSGGTTNILTAAPGSGPAPMSVKFSWTFTAWGESQTVRSISYGDSSSDNVDSCNVGLDPNTTRCSGQIFHPYANPGTYYATLYGSYKCPGGASSCIVGMAAVTVSSGASGTASCRFGNGAGMMSVFQQNVSNVTQSDAYGSGGL